MVGKRGSHYQIFSPHIYRSTRFAMINDQDQEEQLYKCDKIQDPSINRGFSPHIEHT